MHCIGGIYNWSYEDDYCVIDWDNWTVDYAVYNCAYCTLLLMCIVIHMSYPSYCEHVDLLLTPTQVDVAGITDDHGEMSLQSFGGSWGECFCRVRSSLWGVLELCLDNMICIELYVLSFFFSFYVHEWQLFYNIWVWIDVLYCSCLYVLPLYVSLWVSFSGRAPVRSHPRLIGHNWCLIRRGCDIYR